MALYNEERPQDFQSVEGQEKVMRILPKDIHKSNRSGAYLFSGVRGTGKTTVARIVAKALNCSSPKADGSPCGCCPACKEIQSGACLDVCELDAASNNSVEKVRELLDTVQYKPIYKTKVYILDEGHMLSNAASNALLKVLEEPPKDVVFIICTTEKHKILPTIVSRCVCYDFEKISRETIASHLKSVCAKHNTVLEDKALDIIAKAADGSMRDALSILDKFITMDNVTADTVADTLGMAADEIVFSILGGIADQNPLVAIDSIKALSKRGGSLSYLIKEIFEVLLDMVDFQIVGDADTVIGTDEYCQGIIDLSYKISTERAFQIMDEFRAVYQTKGNDIEFSLTASIVGIVTKNTIIDELQSRVSSLESDLQTLKACGIPANSVNSVSPVANPAAEPSTLSPNEDVPSEPGESVSQNPASATTTTTSDDYDASFSYEEEALDFAEEAPPFSLDSQTSTQSPIPCDDSSSGAPMPDAFAPTEMSFDDLVEKAAADSGLIPFDALAEQGACAFPNEEPIGSTSQAMPAESEFMDPEPSFFDEDLFNGDCARLFV